MAKEQNDHKARNGATLFTFFYVCSHIKVSNFFNFFYGNYVNAEVLGLYITTSESISRGFERISLHCIRIQLVCCA